jgi:flavin-dependent dehydrogenase
MSPEAVRILSRLGVIESLEAAGGVAPRGTAVTAPRGASLQGLFARASRTPFRPTGLSISRRILDDQLVSAARSAGARILERTSVEELLYQDGCVAGVLVRDATGRRHVINARLTVGADGLRSVVARRIGRRTHGRPRRVAFVAHMEAVPRMQDWAELHVTQLGYAGLNRISPTRTNVALVVPAALAAQARGQVDQFFFTTLRQFPDVGDRVAAGRVVRRVLTTGPFAAWSGRVIASGALLVGDAADFFDPFTGEGIYSALRGAELAAETAVEALGIPGPVTADRLTQYRHRRRRAFQGKWIVERMIGYGMYFPGLFNRAVARLGRRGAMAHTLIGVTGDFVPAREVLNPIFLARMVL